MGPIHIFENFTTTHKIKSKKILKKIIKYKQLLKYIIFNSILLPVINGDSNDLRLKKQKIKNKPIFFIGVIKVILYDIVREII